MARSQMFTIKLNRFTSYQQTESPSPSPTDFFSIILFYLKEWLDLVSDLFTAYFDKLSSIFPPETRAQWLDAAAHWLPFVVGGALLLCFLCCCLPVILRFIIWIFTGIFNIIKGFFMLLFNACHSVFRCLCCCGRGSVKMMKAPGRGGRVFIPRAGFESNPAAYFQNLRASSPLY